MTNATRNTRSNATSEMKVARIDASNARKAKTTSRETPTIVLKRLHDDIMKSNANATVTTKKMRVWLRANMRDVCAHNDAWIFTQSQYDIVRSHFDAKYAASLVRAAKPKKVRATKTTPVVDAPVVETPVIVA